jgi:hypothetical protein
VELHKVPVIIGPLATNEAEQDRLSARAPLVGAAASLSAKPR